MGCTLLEIYLCKFQFFCSFNVHLLDIKIHILAYHIFLILNCCSIHEYWDVIHLILLFTVLKPLFFKNKTTTILELALLCENAIVVPNFQEIRMRPGWHQRWCLAEFSDARGIETELASVKIMLGKLVVCSTQRMFRSCQLGLVINYETWRHHTFGTAFL